MLWCCLAALFFAVQTRVWALDYTNYVQLFSFSGTNGGGPSGDLTEGVDGMLYGTTSLGGLSNSAFTNGMGTVFRLRKDGTHFEVIHHFGNTADDGRVPNSALVQVGNGDLYGTTIQGGASGFGTIFSVAPDGSAYHIVRHFAGGTNDGVYPRGGLLKASDGLLYGTATSTGESTPGLLFNPGLVYKLGQDGTGYTVVCILFDVWSGEFGDPDMLFDVAIDPHGTLIEMADGRLFGASSDGRSSLGKYSPFGAIYALNKEGSDLSVHTWAFLKPDFGNSPRYPNGPPTDGEDGSLYVTARYGLQGDWGGVLRFSVEGFPWNQAIETPMSDLTPEPLGGLTLGEDGLLYGTASARYSPPYEEPWSRGSVFRIARDGSNLLPLKLFTATSDGVFPVGKLLLASDHGLYGVTLQGGHAGWGTVFALYPEPRCWFGHLARDRNGIVSIDAKGAAGVHFCLQRATNLLQTAWMDVATNIASATGNLSFTNLPETTGSAFYRLTIP